ncbi:hypothetical protein LQV05_002421 [Cryptococcus neoformans]|nr:hypothetical protein LQV05_002421 [Cryptococcus neoformans]
MPGLEPFAVIGLPLAVTGCAHFRRKDSPCHKYLVRVGQLHSTRKHPAHSGVEHSEAMLAQQCELLRQFEQAPQTARQTHVARRAGHLTKATQAHIETLEKSIFAVPGHLSAFDLFPDFDKILRAVVDPIYALLEGILPFYIRKWIARALSPRISTVIICNLAYIRPLQIYFYRVLNNHNAAKTLEELMFQSKGGPVSPDRVSQIFLHATTNYHRKLNYIAEDGERVVFQERQATSQKMAAVRHRDADCFVINTAAFHNIDVLLSALPRTLYQPRRILEDPWEWFDVGEVPGEREGEGEQKEEEVNGHFEEKRYTHCFVVDISNIASGTSSPRVGTWCGRGWPSFRLVTPNVALIVAGSPLDSPLGSFGLAAVGGRIWFGLILSNNIQSVIS